MDIKDLLILGKSISDASNHAEQIRSIQHHDTMMRHYDKEIARHEREAEQANANKKIKSEKNRTDAVEHQATFYQMLLNKPFSEISKHNAIFARSYYTLEQTLSDWILSQKAFKELAYDMGAKLGYSEDLVEELYLKRANEIATSASANEVMPERFALQTTQSQHNLNLAIAQKKNLLASSDLEEDKNN